MKKRSIDTNTLFAKKIPFIIAEMSGNHNRSLDNAREIIRAAAASGAHAIKLQTYKPETMTMRGALVIDDPNSLWNGRELFDLYQEAFTPWDWHKELFDLARNLGLVVFSTPFDESSVDFLESLEAPLYKIASFENTDWPLLRKVAKTGKPVIMSIGAASLSQIAEAVEVLRQNDCADLTLLKCTSTYPASPENTNLATIPHLKQLFNCRVGLSDHTMGIGVAVASVGFGAEVIEKHFTIDRAAGGVDSAFSIEPAELRMLVTEVERAHLAIGAIKYGIQASEEKSTLFKRSLFAVKDIALGDEFTVDNIKPLRPGTGLAPKYYDIVIGRKAKIAIKAGTPLSWEIV